MKEADLAPEDIEATDKDVEYDPKDDENAPNKGGRPEKDFNDCGPRAKKAKIKPLLEQVQTWTKKNNVSSVNETLGHLGMNHANQEVDRKSAAIFKAITEGQDPFAHQKMSVEQALAVKVQGRRGDRTFDIFRRAVKEGVTIPSK